MKKTSFIAMLKKMKNQQQMGFALIATITLMILLALISIGLLTMATTQVRLSQKGLNASDAKAQARLALEVAIGKLQAEMGPDQRISASSSIIDSNTSGTSNSVNAPHILGVWDSWDTWGNRNHSLRSITLTSTYSKSRSPLFRGWLISTPRMSDVTDINAPNTRLGTNEGGRNLQKVCLVGNGTLMNFRSSTNKDAVYAGLIHIDDAKNVQGRETSKQNAQTRKSIAWWVSGENQKVRINLPTFSDSQSNDEMSILRSTWDTPAPDITAVSALSSIARSLPSSSSPDYDRQVRALISRGTMQLAAAGSGARELGNTYHSVSLFSSGLMTDVKFGGLKKDINILTSLDSLPDDFRKNDSDVGLRPYTSEDGSPHVSNRPISSWSQLYLWANLWDSETKEGQDNSATLSWNGRSPYTLPASDADSVDKMMNNRYTYVRHPILLKFYAFVGLKYYLHLYNGGAENSGNIDVNVVVAPVLVWWNPYNVDMHLQGADGNIWGTYTGQYRMMPMLYSANYVWRWSEAGPATNDNNLNNKTENPFSPFGTAAYFQWYHRQIADYGSSLRTTVDMNDDGSTKKGDASIIKAGEILVYSMPVAELHAGDDSSQGMNSIYASKKNGFDRTVDNFALKEGWEEDPTQVSSYCVLLQSSSMYAALTGPDYPENEKYVASMTFAEKTSDLDRTPDNFILAKRYATESKNTQNLGAFVFAAGMMDSQLIGSSHELKNKTQGGASDPEIFAKTMPAVFNMNWGAWEKPLVDLIKFPQELWDNSGATNKRKGQDGQPTDDDTSFVAYYGISAKWSKTPLIGTYPDNKDYRAKTWQHSSPLFWGSQMVNASDMARAYSPYQFEVKYANDDFAPITIANVLSNDGTRLSVFGGPNGEQINKIVAAELPLHPPYSLAGFAGMRLTPGWYSTSPDDAASIAKRFSYQSGVPGVGIGNSFADPMLPADRIFSSNKVSNDDVLADFWDHGYMVNDGLWDSWYTSSLSKRPTRFGEGNAQPLREVISEAVQVSENSNKENRLSNKRFTIRTNGMQASDIIAELTAEDGYKKSAKYIRVDGAFNVNSTNLDAWKAILHGLKKRQLLYMSNNNGPTALSQDQDKTYFSRFGITSNSVSHVDDYGSIGVTNGLQEGETQAWSDLRKYDDRQIDKLAEEMVSQVKTRGPFLNMAEFVNRRLEVGELGVKGALQYAIDASGMNELFDTMNDRNIQPAVNYPNQQAATGSYYTAAPGYLIQSDVLAVLGNILTTRDDTFTIRAYGEVTSRDGREILARAWCEAIVQRTIDYVDPTDAPETPAREIDLRTGELKDSELTKINKAFGRRFEITSFRWLSAEEV